MQQPTAAPLFLMHVYDQMPRHDPDLAAWFSAERVHDRGVLDCKAAAALIEQWQKHHFPKAAMQRTPTLFGRCLLTHGALPEKVHYEQVPEKTAKWIEGTVALPHRFELLKKKYAGPLYEHDARVAFLAHCRHVPVYFKDQMVFDDIPEFVPRRQGWYRATVTVPTPWAHIGLVPAEKITIGQQATYRYPRIPGETFTYWFHESEIELLLEHRWPFKILNRLLFAPEQKGVRGLDPLRLWQEKLSTAIMEAEDREWKLFRDGIRAAALRTIGTFKSNGRGQPETIFNGDEWVDVPAHKPNQWSMRFYHPEWWAAIVARTRVSATRFALSVPFDKIVSIRGDAVVTTEPIAQGLQDDGKVGSYRLKSVKEAK